MSRRGFLARTLAGGSVLAFSMPGILKGAARQYRAAIIGHTGQGNYGHELDVVFNGRPNIQVRAVADPDPQGRTKAILRSGAPRGYSDYQEMLEREKPDLVSIAPRWTHEHFHMAKAALQVGAHLFVEKPFMTTLGEADEILTVATQAGLHIAVAHQMRIAPNTLALQRFIADGNIGELVEIRSNGKQDARAGGEDLVVLGVHVFDLMRFFGGDAKWCTADVRWKGKPATRGDIRPAGEKIGPVLGDDIQAFFGFEGNLIGRFTSKASLRDQLGPWGMHFLGTKGAMMMHLEMIPRIYKFESSRWQLEGANNRWLPWDQDPTKGPPAAERGMQAANARVLDALLQAIETGTELPCSGFAAARAMEFYMAVFESGLKQTRVSMPMANRSHPLQP